MASFTPPPTYADPVIYDPVTGKNAFNPIWLKWFLDVAQFISSNGGTSGTIDHETLTGLQGGGANDHSHLTASQLASLVTLIALTYTGTGTVLVKQSSPSIATPTFTGVAPIVSDAAALLKSAVAMNNGAAAAAGTLLNAPVAGNPTKWVPFDDNGTLRYFPAW